MADSRRVPLAMLDLVHHRTGQAVEAYVDGELASPERVRELEAHLRDCAGCLGDVRAGERVKRSLRRVRPRRPTALSTARLRRWAARLVHARR